MVDCRDSDSETVHNIHLQELVCSSVNVYVTDGNNFKNSKKKPDTLFLYLSALSANILLFVCATFHVWSSPVLPTLKSNNTATNPIGRPITTFETSLLAGLPFLFGLVGSSLVGPIADRIGRKGTMTYTAIVILISSLITAFSYDVYAYIIARCGIFLCQSAVLVLLPIYLTEICEDHNRAKFGCLMGISLPSGHLYSYIIGSVTSITVYTLLCSMPLVLFLIAFFFTPESPVYLIRTGRVKSAIEALKILRRNKSQQEIEKDYENLNESNKCKYNVGKITFVRLLKTKVTRKGLMLALLPVCVQHLSGVSVLMQFMAPIFNKAETLLSGNTISIIAGVTKILMFFTTAIFVEKIGRRPLLLISGYGTGVSLFLLGLFFYWKYTNWVYVNKISWLPILFLMFNLLVYSVGLGPIPMGVMSELFVTNSRTVAISTLVTINGFVVFLLNFMFPIISDMFGIHSCIWLFSFFSFIGTTLIYFILPETKGKSISEIQELLLK